MLEQLSILYLVVELVVAPRAHLGLAPLEEDGMADTAVGIQLRSYLRSQRAACSSG